MGKILPYPNREEQAEELQITLKPQVTGTLKEIAKAKGIDVEAQLYSYLRQGFIKDWDFLKGAPRGKRGNSHE